VTVLDGPPDRRTVERSTRVPATRSPGAGAWLGLPRPAGERTGTREDQRAQRHQGHGAPATRGATTAHARIDVGGGTVITASVTNEAVRDLKLSKGDRAYAVVKASDVMVGVD
jgi:molybdopterin-binding protein